MEARRALVSLDLASAGDALDLSPLANQISNFGNKLDEKQRQLVSLEAPFSVRELDQGQLTAVAAELAANSDLIVVVATGIMSACARAATSALTPPLGFSKTKLLFAGDHLSVDYLAELFESLQGRKISILAMAMEDPPLELSVSLRLFADLVRRRHGLEESRRRIVLVGSESSKTWGRLSQEMGYRLIKIPDRFRSPYLSFSPVTLMPLCAVGLNVDQFLEGGRSLARSMDKQPFEENECFRYAAVREILSSDGRSEGLCLADPRMRSLGEWWRSLMTSTHVLLSSPASCAVPFLVSQACYLTAAQLEVETPGFWSTRLLIEHGGADLKVVADETDCDGLEGLVGRSVHELAQQADRLIREIQAEQGAPQVELRIPKLDAYSLGALMCFFETVANVNQKLAEVGAWNETAAALTAEHLQEVAKG